MASGRASGPCWRHVGLDGHLGGPSGRIVDERGLVGDFPGEFRLTWSRGFDLPARDALRFLLAEDLDRDGRLSARSVQPLYTVGGVFSDYTQLFSSCFILKHNYSCCV